MKMNFYISRDGYGQLRCPRRRRGRSLRAGEEVSAARNTSFHGHRVPIVVSIRLMFAWTEKLSYADARTHCSQHSANVSERTIADWYNYCRELVIVKFICRQIGTGLIGGPGRIVQIDEAKFGRRKYNRGRWIEGHWVLGLIEDGSNDLRLELCPDNNRSATALIQIIRRHVAVGTTIRSDCWGAYQSLPQYGYYHEVVNHSREFVTPEGIHTNRIESMWRPMRRFFGGRLIDHDHFADHLIEYMWRRYCRLNNIEKFGNLLDFIREEYPVNRE